MDCKHNREYQQKKDQSINEEERTRKKKKKEENHFSFLHIKFFIKKMYIFVFITINTHNYRNMSK
jgi:hypothetical protein